MALSPMVVIGCGGSGGKVVVGLRKRVDEVLRRRGWTRGIPAAWQFKWIDVPGNQERYGSFGPLLPQADYVALSSGPRYEDYDEALTFVAGQTGLSRLAGWRPHPQLGLPVTEGAGQMRAVGRAVALTRASVVAEFVAGALDAVPAGLVDLHQLGDELRGGPDPAVAQDPNRNLPFVVVVTSLAGGTGAGVFIDVCDLVRSSNPRLASRIFSVLFTAEVFRGVDGDAGMPSNTVAALSELMSGVLSVGRRMEPLYPEGLGALTGDAGGPAFPYVVGLQPLGGGAPLTTPEECYRAVTETLLATMLDENLKQDFLAYDTVNFVPHSGQLERQTAYSMLNVEGTPGLPPRCGVVSSFGSSKVSVGSAHFGDWARDRLARAVIDHLVSGWRGFGLQLLGRAKALTATDSEIVDFLVDRDREIFFDSCSLWEEDAPDGVTTHDQVLEGILPTERLRSLSAELRTRIIAQLQRRGEQNGAAWVDSIMDEARLREQAFVREVGTALDEGVRYFAEQVVGKLSTAVGGALAQFGLPVASGLVAALRQQCLAAVDQLRKQTSEQRGLANQDPTSHVTAKFFELRSGKCSAGSQFVAEAVSRAVWPGSRRALADRSERAATLLGDVVARVLEPLQDELSKVGSDLADPRFVAEVQGWPRDQGDVSGLYAPPPSEFCLVESGVWGARFEELLRLAPGSVEQARDEIAAGGFPYGPLVSRATAPLAVQITENGNWWGRNVHPVSVELALRPPDVVERARIWVEDTSRPLGKFVASGLGEFLSETDDQARPIPDHRDRLDRFQKALSNAVAMAKPLFSIDDIVMKRMHPGKEIKTSLKVQGFPFGAEHPARSIVSELLPETERPSATQTATNRGVESVLLASRLVSAVQPAVVSSLYEPIASRWGQVVKPGLDRRGAIRGFWTYNRSRLLTESVPLALPAIEAITRGWYVGRFLGLISGPDPAKGMAVHWKDERGIAVTSALPWPLLRDGYANLPELQLVRDDWLPALFEHLGLAMMLWAGQPKILDGYETLYRIGVLEGTKAGTLNTWISTGVQPVDSGTSPQIDGADAKTRHLALQQGVGRLIERLQRRRSDAIHHTVANYSEFMRIPYGSELIDMIVAQLEVLAATATLPDDENIG